MEVYCILPHTVNVRQKIQCLNCPSQCQKSSPADDTICCGYLWMVLASPGPQSSSGVASGRHVVGSVLTSFFLHPDIHWYPLISYVPYHHTQKIHEYSIEISWKFYEKPQDSAIPTYYTSRIEKHISSNHRHLEAQDRRYGAPPWPNRRYMIYVYIIYIYIYWLELKTWYTSYSGTVLTSNDSLAKDFIDLHPSIRPTEGLKVHLQLLNLLIRLTAFLLLLL